MDWNFNPRSPRGERLAVHLALVPTIFISIHAPREGSDLQLPCRNFRIHQISIHAPREGSDQRRGFSTFITAISIHAPREGSDAAKERMSYIFDISIHAPREGSDWDVPVLAPLRQ